MLLKLEQTFGKNSNCVGLVKNCSVREPSLIGPERIDLHPGE
jgi:hypothetical protein